ncbi:MAG: HNH endonuclease signature motif containing protein, partial [Bdellovibrionota bacterium]
IPSTIKQVVYKRDKGQCTHQNCNSNKFLEYDHIIPIAMGGKTTIQNLRLLCRTHNQRAAIEKFGFQKMQPYLNL